MASSSLVTTIFNHPSSNPSDNYLSLVEDEGLALREVLLDAVRTRFQHLSKGNKKVILKLLLVYLSTGPEFPSLFSFAGTR